MTPDRQTPPTARPGRTEPWRIERMVQRVPAHLGETTPQPVSPWIVIGGIILLIMVSCGVLVILLNVPERLKALSVPAVPTATRTPRIVTPAVTNVPATQPPPTPTAGPTPVTTKYKIKSGDTLSSISAQFRVPIEAIKAANGMTNDFLRIGDEILIPKATPTPVGAVAPDPFVSPVAVAPSGPQLSTPTAMALVASPTAAPVNTPGTARHTVKSGETLISIAAFYGSTVANIKSASNIDSDFLSIGQVLIVPIGDWVPTVAAASAPPPATPTAQFAYALPNMMYPDDGESLRGKAAAPTFMWTSVGTLKADEYYRIRIDYSIDGVKKPSITALLKATSYKLDPAAYPGPNASGTDFSWIVTVVKQAPLPPNADAIPGGTPLSPPGAFRNFKWY